MFARQSMTGGMALMAVAGLGLLSGCVSTRSVAELREIQERQGLFTRSLWNR
jgi:hypothetical protein